MGKILTIPQREDLRTRIAALYVRGYGLMRMAKEISSVADYSVSAVTVSKHLKAVLKEWYDNREHDIDQRINTELMKINEVEYEAWKAWERSCKTKTKKTSKQKGTPKVRELKDGKKENYIVSDYVSETEQTEEMVGDPRFLDIIAKCIETRLQWINKGSDVPGPKGGVTNITNNTMLVMAPQEKYIPEKLRQMQAQIIPIEK